MPDFDPLAPEDGSNPIDPGQYLSSLLPGEFDQDCFIAYWEANYGDNFWDIVRSDNDGDPDQAAETGEWVPEIYRIFCF